MKKFLPLLSLFPLAAMFVTWKWNSRSPAWLADLEKSPSLTLYSIEPKEAFTAFGKKPMWGGGAVLGKIVVKDEATKQKILRALHNSLNSDGTEVACSNPRVGVESEDRRSRVSLCYECGNASAYSKGQGFWFQIASSNQTDGDDALNEILSAARIPLSKP